MTSSTSSSGSTKPSRRSAPISRTRLAVRAGLAGLGLLLGAVGCPNSSETGESATEAGQARPRVVRTELTGRCAGKDGQSTCGAQSKSGNCYCEARCEAYGDCCEDYEATCIGIDEPGSCRTEGGGDRCDAEPLSGDCRCDALCELHGDCCDDYGSVCEVDPKLCAAMDAKGVGLCIETLGVTFDGQRCVTLTGCSCEGTACGALFHTTVQCEEELPSCVPSKPSVCGGITGFLCPEGYTCISETACFGSPDCGGTCQSCDKDLICALALGCIDGLSYPTACGPINCDQPTGTCSEAD